MFCDSGVVLVQIKRAIYLTLALVCSILIAEGFVSLVLDYPKNTLGMKRIQVLCGERVVHTFNKLPPWYRFTNVEAGYKSLRKNNVGLSGPDVFLSKDFSNVAVLGNSFIEGMQYNGDSIASGVMQKELLNAGHKINVFNLGASNADPYRSFFLADYYHELYGFKHLILVIEDFDRLRAFFSRYKLGLLFDNPIDYRILPQSKLSRLSNTLRNWSAYLNLVSYLTENRTLRADINPKKKPDKEMNLRTQEISNSLTYDRLLQCLTAYKDRFGDRLILVSLMKNNPFREHLYEWMQERKITGFENQELIHSDNMINGAGHFNIMGNLELGSYMARVLAQELRCD